MGIFAWGMSAALLGIIIAVMEEMEFPGIGPMLACVLALSIPSIVVNLFLPQYLFFIGLMAGAGCAGLAISYLCDMSFRRAFTAVGIYLGIRLACGLAMCLMMI